MVNDKCVEKETGKLSQNEICSFSSYKTECKKREKVCSDITDTSCETYSPITKYCFKFEGESDCKEVKIDDSCQMNSSNQCVAKGSLGKNEACVLNDEKNSCYKTNTGNASLLSLKLFSILLLFFIC